MVLYLIGQSAPQAEPATYWNTGDCVREFSMEERMTVCNMSIEAGARAGMIAPDQTTFDYLRGLPKHRLTSRPQSSDGNCLAVIPARRTTVPTPTEVLTSNRRSHGVPIRDRFVAFQIRFLRLLTSLIYRTEIHLRCIGVHGSSGQDVNSWHSDPAFHRFLHKRKDRRPAHCKCTERAPCVLGCQ